MSTGETRELPPEPLPSIEVKDPAHWDVIIGGMIGVTNDPTGTARRSQAGAPYKIAGKTGTAQVFSVGQHEQYKESEVDGTPARPCALRRFRARGRAETRGRGAGRKRTERQRHRGPDRTRGVRCLSAAARRQARKAEAATAPAPAAGSEE